MQNWLNDNTTYLDKTFTLQVMALMARQNPLALQRTLGKDDYLDLEDYFTMDNDRSFYRFKKEY
jgi:hypothetical protein